MLPRGVSIAEEDALIKLVYPAPAKILRYRSEIEHNSKNPLNKTSIDIFPSEESVHI